MRCKACDYQLWNIGTRQCPECAAAFKPSDYEFAPGTVKFLCPHCGQQYFGTGARGDLVPAMFDCVQCRRRIHMDEMVLIPGEGLQELQTMVDRMPWLERSERGPVKAWFSTIKWAMVQPNRLIRAVPENSSASAAFMYALPLVLLVFGIGLIVPMSFVGLMQAVGRGLPGVVWISAGGTLLGFVVACALLLFLWAAIAHLILLMTGGGLAPFARTCHSIFYSAGASAPAAVPCCGSIVGLIWWIVSAANMLKEAHKVHGGRAAFAAATLPSLIIMSMPFVWYLMMMLFLFGMMRGGAFGGAGAWTPQNQPVSALSMSLIQYGWGSRGVNSEPEHAIELLMSGNLAQWSAGRATPFCYPGTQTTAADIPVSDGTLQTFQNLPKSKQLGELQKLLEGLPQNLVAHRFGDYIFTYHGSNLQSMDSNLWLVVMLPDPDVNGPPAPSQIVLIGTGDYRVTQTTVAQLPGLLQQQNQHRQLLGLSPLPDLCTVTHAAPVVDSTGGEMLPNADSGPDER